jgi:hypothetical protein
MQTLTADCDRLAMRTSANRQIASQRTSRDAGSSKTRFSSPSMSILMKSKRPDCVMSCIHRPELACSPNVLEMQHFATCTIQKPLLPLWACNMVQDLLQAHVSLPRSHYVHASCFVTKTASTAANTAGYLT